MAVLQSMREFGSALTGRELSMHRGESPMDTYRHDQASGGVWVALVALAQSGPGAFTIDVY